MNLPAPRVIRVPLIERSDEELVQLVRDTGLSTIDVVNRAIQCYTLARKYGWMREDDL